MYKAPVRRCQHNQSATASAAAPTCTASRYCNSLTSRLFTSQSNSTNSGNNNFLSTTQAHSPVKLHRPPAPLDLANVSSLADTNAPNRGICLRSENDQLAVVDIDAAREVAVHWSDIHSVSICVDGPNHRKFWRLMFADKHICFPLSVPSQDKVRRRMERLPGFQFDAASSAFLAPLDATKPPEWYFVYADWNRHYQNKLEQQQLNDSLIQHNIAPIPQPAPTASSPATEIRKPRKKRNK